MASLIDVFTFGISYWRRRKNIFRRPLCPTTAALSNKRKLSPRRDSIRKNTRKIEWMSYAKLPFEKPSWLIKGLVPSKSLVMLYGRRGLGKTFIALDIAASVASGLDCLGCEVQNSGRVGYLLAERPEGLKRRLAGWLNHRHADPEKLKNIFVAGSGTVKVDEPNHLRQLITSIRAHLAVPTPEPENPALKLLIIDPLAAHMSGSEDEAAHVTRFTDAILELSETFECSVLVVHHEGKNNFQNRMGARGSSALEAALDTVLYIERDTTRDHHAQITMTKQREFEESPSVWVVFKEVTGLVPGEDMEPIALGKQPSPTSAPPESNESRRKGKMDKEVRTKLLAFIAERASSQSENIGVTVKDLYAHILAEDRNSEGVGKRLNTSIIRTIVDDMARARRIIHLNPGKKPYRYGPAR